MTWVPRSSDNTPRTPSPYVGHDANCDPAPAPQPYSRHDANCVDAADQPASIVVVDQYGNTNNNYNGDYVSN